MKWRKRKCVNRFAFFNLFLQCDEMKFSWLNQWLIKNIPKIYQICKTIRSCAHQVTTWKVWGKKLFRSFLQWANFDGTFFFRASDTWNFHDRKFNKRNCLHDSCMLNVHYSHWHVHHSKVAYLILFWFARDFSWVFYFVKYWNDWQTGRAHYNKLKLTSCVIRLSVVRWTVNSTKSVLIIRSGFYPTRLRKQVTCSSCEQTNMSFEWKTEA